MTSLYSHCNNSEVLLFLVSMAVNITHGEGKEREKESGKERGEGGEKEGETYTPTRITMLQQFIECIVL